MVVLSLCLLVVSVLILTTLVPDPTATLAGRTHYR